MSSGHATVPDGSNGMFRMFRIGCRSFYDSCRSLPNRLRFEGFHGLWYAERKWLEAFRCWLLDRDLVELFCGETIRK